MIKKITKIVYIVFGLVSVLGLAGLFWQDIYRLIPINEYWTYLSSDSPRKESQLVFSLLYTILMGVFTAYFTVLSIILSRKKVAFWDYFFYTKSYDFLISIIITIIVSLIFFFNRFSYLAEICLSILMVLCLLEFGISIIKISYLENAKMGKSLLRDYLLKSKNKKNIGIATSFINNFFNVCFPKQQYECIEEIYKEWPNRQNTHLEIQEFYISLFSDLSKQNLSTEDFESTINFLLKRTFEILSEGDNTNLDLLKKVYDLIFETYKQMIWKDKCRNSFVMRIKEPVYFYFLQKKENLSDEMIQFYLYLLSEVKQIIYVSYYHCNFNIIREELHEFMGMSQFLDLYPSFEKIINEYEHHIVDLAIRIFNIIQIKKNTPKLCELIEPLIMSISKIEVFDGDYEMYDELLPPVDVYEVYYTRNFYLALLFIFLKIKISDDKFENVISKLFYNDGNLFIRGYQYSYLLPEIEKIKGKPSDIENIISTKNGKWLEKVEELDKLLKSKIEKIRKESFNELRNKDVTEQLKIAIDEEWQNLRNQVSDICENTENKNLIDFFKLKSNFIFSKRVLVKDSHISQMPMNYKNFIKDYLLRRYIQTAKIKYISNFSEIDSIEKIKELYISSRTKFDLYSKSGVFIENNKLLLGNNSITINWSNISQNMIVVADDFRKSICMPEININKDQANYKEESNDIQITVDYDLLFKAASNEHFVYNLIN